MHKKMGSVLSSFGHRFIEGVWRVGAAGRLFFYVCIYLLESLKRPSLIIREVYATGVLSLLIIWCQPFLWAWYLACRAITRSKNMARQKRLGC